MTKDMKSEERSTEYERGWLDAYARRGPGAHFHKLPALYRDGYVAGKRDREDVDRKLGIAVKGVQRG